MERKAPVFYVLGWLYSCLYVSYRFVKQLSHFLLDLLWRCSLDNLFVLDNAILSVGAASLVLLAVGDRCAVGLVLLL